MTGIFYIMNLSYEIVNEGPYLNGNINKKTLENLKRRHLSVFRLVSLECCVCVLFQQRLLSSAAAAVLGCPVCLGLPISPAAWRELLPC